MLPFERSIRYNAVMKYVLLFLLVGFCLLVLIGCTEGGGGAFF